MEVPAADEQSSPIVLMRFYMSEILRTENISFRYDEKYPALKNVSVAFHGGELVAVLGCNGAGKSTFFLCCNGVLTPESGEIFYKGRKLSGSKKDIIELRQAVGLVFQDPDSQIIAGTVESEVSFGPMNLRLPRDEVQIRVDNALSQMNLSGYRDYAPQYLSGGEKKRVSIADILAMRSEIILLDEPTASLDPQNTDALESILLELNRQGITVVISTHDVDFAYRIAQRAVVFANGEVIADGSIDDVFESEDILAQAGLRKPMLLSAAQLLEKRFAGSLKGARPKDVSEFEKYISELMQ